MAPPQQPRLAVTPTLAVGADGFDAKDTYFNGDLYISNGEDAFNTILITAAVVEATGDLATKEPLSATVTPR